MNVLEANTVAPEVTVTAPSLVPTPAPTAPVKVILPAPAVRPRVCVPLSVLPKVIPAPADGPVVVSTVLFWVKVTPPVPKLITSLVLVIAAPTLDAALPVKAKPPLNAKVALPLPKVTRPELRKSTLATKVLPVPVMLTVVAVIAVVIKSLTVTAPVNAADAPLVIVKSVMATVVPVMAPVVPASSPRLKFPLMPAPKVIAAPFTEPDVASIATEPVVNATVLLNITASPDVVIFTPAMVAALATVNALSNKEVLVAKVTPVPPAFNVVIPLMVPPPETAFTVIVPAPVAVIFNEPAAVMKSSSASVRLNPAPAVPKNTFTPELLVIPIAPVTFIAAPIETSAALVIVRAASSMGLPTAPVKVTVPVPAVRPRVCVPLSVPLKVMSAPVDEPVVVFTVLLCVKFTPPVPKLITSPELVMAALTKDVAPPVKAKPPSNANVSLPLPRAIRPVFRKSTSATKVLPVPIMLMVVAVAAVIKSLTVTAPVKAADTPLVMVRLLMATDVPVIAPAVPAFRFRLKELAPSKMPKPKEMSSPEPAPVVMIMSLVKVTPRRNAMPSLVLSILPPKRFAPEPFCVNALPTVRLAPTAVVNRPPLLVTTIVVPTTLAPTPLILSATVFTVPKLKAPVRFRSPVNVVDTAPKPCVKLAAVKVLDANTVDPEVTVTSPRRVPPTAPMKVMLPARPGPAANPRLCAPATVPSSVLLNRILSKAAPPVLMVMPLCRVTARRKEMPEAPGVVLSILPPKRFNPVIPSCVNWLPTVRLAPTAVVNRPALVTSIVVPTTLAPTPLILRIVPVKSN